MASATDSDTKVLISGSPKEPSMRAPNPPANPFTPTKPTPSTSTLLPSSSLNPPSQRIFFTSSTQPLS